MINLDKPVNKTFKHYINTEFGMLVTQIFENGRQVGTVGTGAHIEYFEFDVIRIGENWYEQGDRVGNLIQIERMVG